ncbi:MAG: hypothetical protein GEV06_28775 [Luteitalea sp.]|nr:hypothetical protein [Luteitalea sp.]
MASGAASRYCALSLTSPHRLASAISSSTLTQATSAAIPPTSSAPSAAGQCHCRGSLSDVSSARASQDARAFFPSALQAGNWSANRGISMILRELVLSYRPTRDADDQPICVCVQPVRDPADAARFLIPLLAAEPHEVIGGLYLNTRRHVLGWRLLARGTLDRAILTPREALQPALLVNASALLIAHSHPSGICDPSPEDIALTGRLKQAAALFEIELLDHLIIGVDGKWSSLQNLGFF